MKVESIDGVKTQYVFKRQSTEGKECASLVAICTYNEM